MIHVRGRDYHAITRVIPIGIGAEWMRCQKQFP
jgi:hypothetical protein